MFSSAMPAMSVFETVQWTLAATGHRRSDPAYKQPFRRPVALWQAASAHCKYFTMVISGKRHVTCPHLQRHDQP